MADPEKVIAVGEPSDPLDDVLPFLAHLPNVISYNPGTLALVMRRRPGFITIEPRRISITQVADSSEAVSLLDALTDAINATRRHGHELTAVSAPRRSPRPWISGELSPNAIAASAARPPASRSPSR
jgi:ArsR family metal-binding transcriptional regulator